MTSHLDPVVDVLDAASSEAADSGTLLSWAAVDDSEVRCNDTDDHVYSIASMSKSFTAASVLGICHGLIDVASRRPSLDDTLKTWIPRLQPPVADATIRDALTMSTGLPPDDPWADRQQAMPRDEFEALLGEPLLTTFAPGTGYAYSNLDYAILGHIVEQATGRSFLDVVTTALLDRVGMTQSYLDVAQVPEEKLAPGLGRDGSIQPLLGPGTFSPIGGLICSAKDVGVWVSRFITAWSGDDGWDRVLRDMQQIQRYFTSYGPVTEGYGYGLHVAVTGQEHVVYHCGGYPGYGSTMMWHPRSGVGVVVLANQTYHPAIRVAAHALETVAPGAADLLLPSQAKDRKACDAVHPSPMSPLVRDRLSHVERVIREWSQPIVDHEWSPTVAMDLPLDQRKEAFAEAVKATGESSDAAVSIVEVTPNRSIWRVEGPLATRQVTASVNPLGQVQALDVRIV
ncbi:serine hydrolase domain-containing protein [Cutibacterium sp. V947]|uniref:serine hydrolase domain-containing protein n=1 Tax=Cutibacterium sp. V947 TaxID=3446480 RepID=UPI003EE3642B